MARTIVRRETTSHVEMLERLLELATAAGSHSELSAILDAIADTLDGFVPFDRMEFARIVENGRVIRTEWVYTSYLHVVLGPGFETTRVGDRSERPEAYTVDIGRRLDQTPEGHPHRLLAAEGITATLVCPLNVGSEVVGYLFFGTTRLSLYPADSLVIMERAAQVVSGALHTASLRDEIEQRNEELESLNRFRTRYLGMVGHELRTPLTGVVGLAAVLRDGVETLSPEEIAEIAGLVAEQADDAGRIVEDILVAARAEQGALDVYPEIFAIRSELERVVDEVGLDQSIVSGDDSLVFAESGRVRQIIRNLLTNAIRYGGGDRRVEVEADEIQVVIRVSDDGTGVDPEVARRLFEAFSSGATAGSTGLGLWLSRLLARLMGGELTHRRVGERTVFELRLIAGGTP